MIFLTINTNDPRPIYQQVADGIKELIAQGKLSEGASLPPVRQLAADLGVNLNTIATAYRELQKDGLIVIKHGTGSMVASRTITTTYCFGWSASTAASVADASRCSAARIGFSTFTCSLVSTRARAEGFCIATGCGCSSLSPSTSLSRSPFSFPAIYYF